MKSTSVLSAAIISLLLCSCNRQYDNFLHNKHTQKIIALQPLGEYNTEQLNFISREISSFFGRKVIILKSVTIPESYQLIKNAEIYSADSILNMLSGTLNDEIIEVVGLTHKDIYILKTENNKTDNPLFDYRISPVFGFGDFPGNCSVISDYMFKTTDTTLFKHRLRTVIFHEMGHNLFLDHCSTDECIMSDKNGKISMLDKCENDYCSDCKRKL
ncbi:MAG: hypothetical protein ACXWWC_00320 [Chitinophagaceae bacterium]